MGWIATLKTVIAVARELIRVLREIEKQGAARLSPAAAQRDRRRLQRLAVRLHDGENIGLRRLTTLDDHLDTYLRDLLQSELLTIYLAPETSELDRIAARAAINCGADGLDEPRVVVHNLENTN